MTARLEPCGTYGAYGRHIRAKEEPCAACRAANAAYGKGRRDAFPGRVKRSTRAAKARQAALRRLSVLHADEFASLLRDARREADL